MQNSLRPIRFENFIGQNILIKTLKIMITSAKKRRSSIDHLLFYGGSGFGKTSLSTIIAKEFNTPIRYAQGSLLEKKADILALVGSLQKHEIIFIDEIHAINKNIEEVLYSIMEDNVVDISVGPEGDSKIMRMKIPSFTLIGATTKISNISKPLKDRFGLVSYLVNYNISEITQIILNSAQKLKINISKKAAKHLASYCSGTPRIANSYLKRCLDVALSQNTKYITLSIVQFTLNLIGIYLNGLTSLHIEYLKVLNKSYSNKGIALESLSGILIENKKTIEDNIEPFLLKLEYIEKTSRGRKITIKGKQYLQTYKNNYND